MTAAFLARRRLFRNRGRLLTSIGGVALALSLTLALDAIYAGVANGLTAYIDHAGADVWVSQAGVRNLHMVASWLPASVTSQVQAVDGVRDATPILYTTDTIASGGERGVAYVVGVPHEAPVGGPWQTSAGASDVLPGSVIVDAAFARRAGAGVGDSVTVLGREMRVAGLSEGTASLVNTVAFVPFGDFRSARGGAPVVSFVLVRLEPGVDAAVAAAAIERAVPGVTAQTTAGFANQERSLVMDMSADVITIMNGVGFFVALAVVALTVYISTLSNRREFGVLKAIGARDRLLYGSVLAQALISVAIGTLLALAFTALLAALVPRTGIALAPALTGAAVLKVAGFGVVVALIAGLLPIRQVARIDPASTFRRGATL